MGGVTLLGIATILSSLFTWSNSDFENGLEMLFLPFLIPFLVYKNYVLYNEFNIEEI